MIKATRTVLVLAVMVAAWPASAQQATGSIAGVIVDNQGAAVPGAAVTAHNVNTGFARTATTGTSGLYALTALPVGVYDVVAELSGFTRLELHGILVRISETHDLNLTLRIAQVSETVTVTAEAPLISTTSSSVGQVVDIDRIKSLPLDGRQFANLAAMIPGV